jgi:hypothetical protein
MYEGMYKIGFTDRDPDIRIDELYTTGVPTKFAKIYECLVENAYELEQKLHKELSEYRVVDNREFFKCDVDKIFKAIDYIKERDKLYFLHEKRMIKIPDSSQDEARLKEILDRLAPNQMRWRWSRERK